MIIPFWGGPRDGSEKVQRVMLSEEPIYCTSDSDELYYHSFLLKHLQEDKTTRTVTYHRYVLDTLDNGKVVYKYDGEV